MQDNQPISQANQQFDLYKDQVSGKTPKFTDKTGHYIYKKVSQKQLQFYQYIQTVGNYSGNHCIARYIPKYRGIYHIDKSSLQNKQHITQQTTKKDQWINHISSRMHSNHTQSKQQYRNQLYIKMINITQNYSSPCIMDIKLGKKQTKNPNKSPKKTNKNQSPKKYKSSITQSHDFRINGMSKLTTQNQEGQHEQKQYFISKYYFQDICDKSIQEHLGFFFYDGRRIDLQLLSKVIEEVKDIVQALLMYTAGRFNSSSLLVCYDGREHSRYAVKLIDFDQYQKIGVPDNDMNIIQGLKNALGYLNNIQSNKKQHEQRYSKRELRLFYEEEVIPERIMKKYQKTILNDKQYEPIGKQQKIIINQIPDKQDK